MHILPSSHLFLQKIPLYVKIIGIGNQEQSVSKLIKLLILLGAAGGGVYYFTHNSGKPVSPDSEIAISFNGDSASADSFVYKEDTGADDQFSRVTETSSSANNPNITESDEAKEERRQLGETSAAQQESTAESSGTIQTAKNEVVKKEINVLGDVDLNVARNTAAKDQDDDQDSETEKEQQSTASEPAAPTPEMIVQEFKSKFKLPIKLSKKETLTNFQYTASDGFTYVIRTSDGTIDASARNYYARYACQNEQVKGLFDYSKTVSFAFVNNKSGKTISRVNVNPSVCKKIQQAQTRPASGSGKNSKPAANGGKNSKNTKPAANGGKNSKNTKPAANSGKNNKNSKQGRQTGGKNSKTGKK